MNNEQVKAALLLTEIVVRLEYELASEIVVRPDYSKLIKAIKPLLEKVPPDFLPISDAVEHYTYALETGRVFYVHSRLGAALESLKEELLSKGVERDEICRS